MRMMAVLWDDPFTLPWRQTVIYSLLVLLMSGARTFGDETFNGEVTIIIYKSKVCVYIYKYKHVCTYLRNTCYILNTFMYNINYISVPVA